MAKANKILDSATAIVTGEVKALPIPKLTFQATGKTTAGAGAASVDIEVSNDKIVWMKAMTIALTLGTTEAGDGQAFDASWAFVRAKLTAISGTGASVSVTMAG